MPAKSQAQRELLNARFGHAWVKKHHFDNKGKLPEHVGDKKKGKAMKKKSGGMPATSKSHGKHHPHFASLGKPPKTDTMAHTSHAAGNKAHGTGAGMMCGDEPCQGKAQSANEAHC